MATGDSVAVLKQCVVAPPPGTAAEISLPLTFFDILWVYFFPIQRLVFYELPLSRTQFLDNFIPELQNSLSSTLKNFLPLAGKLIDFTNSSMPEIRYIDGDGVSLIIAESNNTLDFNYLASNYPRDSSQFHHLVPPLQASSNESCKLVVPVLAIQVTLFPNIGISIGISNHHTVGDARSIFSFMKSWALNSKFGENPEPTHIESLPFIDTSVISDAKGLRSIFLNQVRSLNLPSLNTSPASTNKVRATFVLGLKHIQKLKNLVQTKRQTLKHLSSFTVICAYLWTCLMKTLAACGETVDEEELDLFAFTADCRERLDPPLPANYFGNCLIVIQVTAKNGELLGDEGIIIAAEKIGEALHQKLQNKEEILKDAETWMSDATKFNIKRVMSLAGSPRFNYYGLDFGWGKPLKFEFISIEDTGAFSLSGCRESEGDVEVGLSFSKPKIDAFTSVFNEGLAAL